MSTDPLSAALARLHAAYPDLPEDGGRVWEPVEDEAEDAEAPTPLERADLAVAEARRAMAFTLPTHQRAMTAALDALIAAVEARTRAQVAAESATDSTPIPLRWGLNDVLWGDDDSVTVLLSGPAGEPYWLELDPERAAVLRQDLAGPDGEGATAPADACPLHSPTGALCDCGHAGGADCHPKES